MKTTVIITVRGMGRSSEQVIRDAQELTASELIAVINRYIASGWEVVALEEFDGDIEDFYSKTLTDDDIDAMAADIPA